MPKAPPSCRERLISPLLVVLQRFNAAYATLLIGTRASQVQSAHEERRTYIGYPAAVERCPLIHIEPQKVKTAGY